MTASEIIEKYITFFEKRGHKRIANSPLVPQNDPTTLFTSSGMQPLVPYLLGEPHPSGKRLVNVQNCFRAVDIDEVGDNHHTTFFRMLGNWSLGDYFKKEEIPWLWELLTKEFGLPKEKLFITIFKGGSGIPYDQESYTVWSELLQKEGFDPKVKIFAADVTKNWWSRSGVPENMPVGEIGGPDTEVYYKLAELEHKSECKDNPIECECGKFIEIANSVFIQYQKQKDGSFKELPQKNVDYGGGLERLLAAIENKPDIFETSLYKPIVKKICDELQIDYKKNKGYIQVITDHIKAATFLIRDGVMPSNKLQGYILRRLLRRIATKAFLLNRQKSDSKFFRSLIKSVVDMHQEDFGKIDLEHIGDEVSLEIRKFRATLERGLQRLNKSIQDKENLGLAVFNLFQSYGYPLELTVELLRERGIKFTESDMQQFEEGKKLHIELSKTASAGMFKGGLADHSEKTIMGHTATHLLHQALRDMFGTGLHQTGSNITPERVRFDFNFDRNLTADELKKVENTVDEKIKENLSVHFEMLPLQKAKEVGAIGLFNEKYSDKVKVYFVGDYSIEFCGGPHVTFTSEIKSFRIIKQENIGKGNRRLYAKVG